VEIIEGTVFEKSPGDYFLTPAGTIPLQGVMSFKYA